MLSLSSRFCRSNVGENQLWAQSLGGTIGMEGEESLNSTDTTQDNAIDKWFLTAVQVTLELLEYTVPIAPETLMLSFLYQEWCH